MSSLQYARRLAPLAIMLAVAASLAGCAGNGQGLNDDGLPGPASSSSGELTADFQSIQDHVFTPICSPCHSGAGAPEHLMLDAAHSYNLLVGVPSTEESTVDRVKAGDPDNSYIVLKIQGSPGIDGVRMPFGEPPLPQSTIDVIRQWIANGAPKSAAAASGDVKAMQRIQALASATPAPFNVTQTSPLDGAVVDPPVSHIVVSFNQEVDATLVNYTNLTVERVSSTQESASADVQAVRIPSYATLAEGNPASIIIKPAAPLLPGTYRVTVRGTGGGALANLNAQPLGSDYSFTFTTDTAP